MVNKGIFWITDTEDLIRNNKYCFKIPCDIDGIPLSYEGLNSKNGQSYNHELFWNCLPKELTNNRKYNYYPRGRVEILHGKARIYLNPSIATSQIMEYLIEEFELDDLLSVRMIPDGSSHYESII